MRLSPRRAFVGALLTSAFALFVACSSGTPQDYSACVVDSDCPHDTCSSTGHCQVCGDDGCTLEPSCALIGCSRSSSDAGAEAEAGPKVCATTSDCDAKESCVAGLCVGERTCSANGDCETEEVCLNGVCGLVGECTLDAHCWCIAPKCENHQCTGDSTCVPLEAGVGAALPCTISNECPDKFYCIGGACQFATECVKHADCPPSKACFHEACWTL